MLAPQKTKLAKEKVLAWFNGAEKYVAFHQQEEIDTGGMEEYFLE